MEDLFNLGVKAIIRNGEGKILVLKVSQKAIENVHGNTGGVKYDIPGGRVKVGDTMDSTLRKEIREETGFEMVSSRYLMTVFSEIRLKNELVGNVGLILAIHEVSVRGDSIKLDDENDSFEWATPLQASGMLGDKYTADFCEKIKNL